MNLSVKQLSIIHHPTFNPNYALDFVMKAKNTIKISTHGLF